MLYAVMNFGRIDFVSTDETKAKAAMTGGRDQKLVVFNTEEVINGYLATKEALRSLVRGYMGE